MKNNNLTYWVVFISGVFIGPILFITGVRASSNLYWIDPLYVLVPLSVIIFIVVSLRVLIKRRSDLSILRRLCLVFIPLSIIINSLIWLLMWTDVGNFYPIWATYMTLGWLIIFAIIGGVMHFSSKAK